MSNAVRDALAKSRLADVIEQVERGEPVDVQRVAALQAADLAMAGRAVLAEAIELEDQFDEQFKRFLETNWGD